MRAEEVAFVGALVHRFPVLLPILQVHLDDYETLLPHVFLADVTRWLVGKSGSRSDSDVNAVLLFLEACFSEGEEEERELISASFLENVPDPGEAGSELRGRLGPALAQGLDQIG